MKGVEGSGVDMKGALGLKGYMKLRFVGVGWGVPAPRRCHF